MELPPELEASVGDDEDVTISHREYDDESVIAVDFGHVEGKPTVDIVDDTAIVVLENEQYEFDVPADASEVTVNDGILTIKGR